MIIGKPFLVKLLRYKFRSVRAISKIEHFTYKHLQCTYVHLGKNTVPKTSTNSLDLRMILCLPF